MIDEYLTVTFLGMDGKERTVSLGTAKEILSAGEVFLRHSFSEGSEESAVLLRFRESYERLARDVAELEARAGQQ
jgi:hypothetical protein